MTEIAAKALLKRLASKRAIGGGRGTDFWTTTKNKQLNFLQP
jgi:hypothetical protein